MESRDDRCPLRPPLIFRHENQEIPLIYLDHVGKLYFSKVRIF